MLLELNPMEAEDLWRALDVRVHALQVELTHTDTHDYRRTVRDTLDRMEALRARVERELKKESLRTEVS